MSRAGPAFKLFDHEFEPTFKATRSEENKPKAPRFGLKRGGFVPDAGRAAQFVVVTCKRVERDRKAPSGAKAFAKSVRLAANYLERGLEASRGAEGVFGQDGPVQGVREAVEGWGKDTRFYRLSLNPQHGERLEDPARFAREVMDAVEERTLSAEERAAGRKLEWVGVVHRDIPRTHCHVLIRGQVDREELCLRPSFERAGLHNLAREVASRDHHLGLRPYEEIERRPYLDRTPLRERGLERGVEREQGWGWEREQGREGLEREQEGPGG